MRYKNDAAPEKPRALFFGSIAISAILILLAFTAGLRRIPDQEVWKGEPSFNAENAYSWTRKLARGHPNRVPWRPERQAAADFLKVELHKLGYEVSTITFSEVIGSRQVEGLENIYAVKQGVTLSDEFLVVLAHYDITDTTIEGAADDASGVGTVLELARLFKDETTRRNIVFLLTDSEEFGAFWGARAFAEQFPQADKIVAAVSLDFVAPDDQKDIMVLSDGLQSGYTPLWLRELALRSIRAVPYAADDTKNILEYVQRAILIPPADHGALLKAGIPALNLFGRSSDFAHQMGKIHHTPNDNMMHLKLESFIPYGKSAEILLRSLDSMPRLTHSPGLRNSNYWKLSDSHYLEGSTVAMIHFLLIIPFFTYIALLMLELSRLQPIRLRKKQILRVLRSEAKGFGLLLASLLSGYALLRFLPDLKIIEKYEMFPATQKSEILYNPKYFALALIVAFTIAVAYALSRVFASRTEGTSPNEIDRQVRHCLLGIILGLIMLLAYVKNSYLSTLLLLPPSYFWMYMRRPSKRDNARALNLLLFSGGLLAFIAICITMTMYFHIGVFYWYLFLAVSYGLISAYAAILALAVMTVGIRILRNLVL